MRALSQRERKLVALAIAMAAVAIGWLMIVRPVLDGFAERAERRESLTLQLAQNDRLIARTETLRRTAETQALQAELYALRAADSGEAAELLKARMADALGRVGGDLRGGDGVEARPGWIGASVNGVVTYDQLLRLLESLANSTPYLSIDALSVTADRSITTNRLEPMDIHVEASIPFAAAKTR